MPDSLNSLSETRRTLNRKEARARRKGNTSSRELISLRIGFLALVPYKAQLRFNVNLTKRVKSKYQVQLEFWSVVVIII